MMDCPNFDPDDHNMTAVIQDEMEEGADFFFLFKSKKSFPQSSLRILSQFLKEFWKWRKFNQVKFNKDQHSW